MSEPVVFCKDLVLGFPGESFPLRGVSLELAPGEVLGVLGESGAGKSLLARALYGLNQFIPSLSVSGTIQRPDRQAMIFQDPGQYMNPGQSIRGHFSEVLRAGGVPKSEWKTRVADLLGFVDLPIQDGFLHSRPGTLSGGQQQRVMIALAMAQNPAVLYADEPVTALDGVSRELVLSLLRKLAKHRNVGVFFISHDLKAIDAIADRVAVMYAGRVIERQSTADFFAAPQHPYSRALLLSHPGLHAPGDYLAEIPGDMPEPGMVITGCPYAPRCPYQFERCTRELPLLQLRNTSSTGVSGGGLEGDLPAPENPQEYPEVACHLFEPLSGNTR